MASKARKLICKSWIIWTLFLALSLAWYVLSYAGAVQGSYKRGASAWTVRSQAGVLTILAVTGVGDDNGGLRVRFFKTAPRLRRVTQQRVPGVGWESTVVLPPTVPRPMLIRQIDVRLWVFLVYFAAMALASWSRTRHRMSASGFPVGERIKGASEDGKR